MSLIRRLWIGHITDQEIVNRTYHWSWDCESDMPLIRRLWIGHALIRRLWIGHVSDQEIVVGHVTDKEVVNRTCHWSGDCESDISLIRRLRIGHITDQEIVNRTCHWSGDWEHDMSLYNGSNLRIQSLIIINWVELFATNLKISKHLSYLYFLKSPRIVF